MRQGNHRRKARHVIGLKFSFYIQGFKKASRKRRCFSAQGTQGGNAHKNLAFPDTIRQKRTNHPPETHVADILIIDDDTDFSRSFQRIIERMGHTCNVAHSIREALALMAGTDCDLIFLDVNLPDGNGLAHIKQFQALPSLPEVVILTGDGDSDGAALAIANGAWDYVGKPISVSAITLILQRAMAYRASKGAGGRRKVKRSAIIGESPAIMG